MRIPSVLAIALAAATAAGCADDSRPTRVQPAFEDHLKNGDRSLLIVGDYFNPRYALELASVAKALSPGARQVFLCTDRYRSALDPLLVANGIDNVVYRTMDPASPILTQWARDVAVAGAAGGRTTLIVSPDKHAGSERAAAATAELLRRVFPGDSVQIAPFVFEGGNVAFVRAGGHRFMIVGRKVLFDNGVYQRHTWARGYDTAGLLSAMAETFGVERVFVVGRAPTRPDTRMYFEYHIDMGMVVLDDGRAVVSRLAFGEPERRDLEDAIRAGRPEITPFTGPGDGDLLEALSARLGTVALEYEDYASLLDSLGVVVHRSPVGWRQVLGSMSWTNVVQVGGTILMPLYPDTLRGVTESVTTGGGRVRMALDLSDLDRERFELTDLNRSNRELYESLGYRVIPVPEYLHYMMGGLHCFVNVIE